VRFLWAKGVTAKNIHKEMFRVYGGKCLVTYSCSQMCGKHFADDEEVETEVRKWLRQQSKDSMLWVLTHWKSVGTSVSMLMEDMSRNKCFSSSNITCFTFHIHL
jgi:hypothetical protein